MHNSHSTPFPWIRSWAYATENHQKSLAYFSHLATLVLLFFIQNRVKRGGGQGTLPSSINTLLQTYYDALGLNGPKLKLYRRACAKGGPGPPVDILGLPINKLTLLKTAVSVLNFKFWLPLINVRPPLVECSAAGPAVPVGSEMGNILSSAMNCSDERFFMLTVFKLQSWTDGTV